MAESLKDCVIDNNEYKSTSADMYFILSADALVSTGLADLGYGYVNIGTVPYFDQQDQILLNGSFDNVANNVSAEIASFGNVTQPIAGRNKVPYKISESVTLQTMDNQANPHEQKNNTVSLSGVDSLDSLFNDRLQTLESPVSSIHEPYSSLVVDSQQSSLPEQVFTITDVSPTCVSSTEKSKVVVTGFFLKDYMHLSNSNLLCVCGDVSVPAEIVQGESGCNSIVCWGEAKFGPQNPDECTTTDLAYMRGHDGLEAYLSEKSLVQHFNGWKYQWLTGN
ncbi:hypothetical protein JHK82_050296 [Glycine max]|nr:hypothetical protein JHK82_050296 [Glycine max]KAG5094609.1 hypothetical protein JHK84_050197 [Glycine max]